MRLSTPQKVVLRKLRDGEQPTKAETYSVDSLIRRKLVAVGKRGYALTDQGRSALESLKDS